jgi:hypothetical protein
MIRFILWIVIPSDSKSDSEKRVFARFPACVHRDAIATIQ